ncbi:MAG: spondin domain-containing protein [Cyclobacteriaceae bacterium]
MFRRHNTKAIMLSLLLFGTFGCKEVLKEILDEHRPDAEPTTFMVKIENVSVPGTVDTDRADGVVPLSPGVYATYKHPAGAKAVFEEGKPADEGTELIAEDGMPAVKAEQLENEPKIGMSGVIEGPGGPILPGEYVMIEVEATPGYYFQFETMFVQSNDWFYGFSGKGLPLFDGDEPMYGDVTEYVALYDAGTEEDTAPGTGDYQVLAQEMGNAGPDDSVNKILSASERHPNFTIPHTASVIKVTVMPQ